MSTMEIVEPTKVCTLCGERPLSAFGKDKTKKDGYKARCRDCRNRTKHQTPAKVITLVTPKPVPKPKPVKMLNCSNCGPLPFTEFHSDKTKKTGYHTRCKNCRNKVSQAYRVVRTEARKALKGIKDAGMMQVPIPTPYDEALIAAKDALAGQFPTAYAKFVHSELLKRELVTPSIQSRHGWASL